MSERIISKALKHSKFMPERIISKALKHSKFMSENKFIIIDYIHK